MYCKRCGGPANEHDRYCQRCGAPLSPIESPVGDIAPSARQRNHLIPIVLAVVLACLIVGGAVAIVLSRQDSSSGTPVAQSPTAHPTTTSPTTAVTSPSATTPARDFASVYRSEQSGVVRIETLSCSAAGVGSGFLLSSTLVATVEHVVDQSALISLIVGDQRATGTVIGTDATRDLALVRSDRPLTGHHFAFARARPAVGDRVAAIGFPVGDPITLTQGGVSGLDRNIEVNGVSLSGLIETDTAINPGNSGGPLVALDGTVVGLVDAQRIDANGIGYAVPAFQARAVTDLWRNNPAPQSAATCQNPLGPSQSSADVPPPSGGGIGTTDAAGIATAFNTYFDGINTGDYSAAYHVFSSRKQAAIGNEAAFAAGDATSYDSGVTVLDAGRTDADTVRVALAFTSLQRADKGPNGHDTCDNWTIDYTMIRGTGGTWYIDAAHRYHGSWYTSC